MARRRGYRGLCSTCANAERCTFPRNRKHAIFDCEEFLRGDSSPTIAGEGRPPPRPEATPGDARSRRAALCRDCEARETCELPKPEGGVWECQEYR